HRRDDADHLARPALRTARGGSQPGPLPGRTRAQLRLRERRRNPPCGEGIPRRSGLRGEEVPGTEGRNRAAEGREEEGKAEQEEGQGQEAQEEEAHPARWRRTRARLRTGRSRG